MSRQLIKHEGEVVRVSGDRVFVRMTVNSACGSCGARQACGVSESADKIVEVATADASTYSVGESVEVALASRAMGAKSVLWAYVVPFFVMCVVLVALHVTGVGEGIAVVATLLGVAGYYALLYALRSKLEQTINFIIIKQTR